MSEFHAIQGWYFERLEDGAVRVRHGDGPQMEVVELDANTWASAVASVCHFGEMSETYRQALDFHMGLVPLIQGRVPAPSPGFTGSCPCGCGAEFKDGEQVHG